MATVQTKFGTFTFGNATNARVNAWRESLLVKSEWAPRHLSEGSQYAKELYTGRKIVMGGTVAGTSLDDARSNLDELIFTMSGGLQLLQRYNDRQLLAALSGDFVYTEKQGTALALWNWSCTLRSEDPWWSGALVTDNFSDSGAGPYTKVLTANAGTVSSRLIVTMTLTSASITAKTLVLRNDTSGKELKVHEIDWNQNGVIEIDFERRLVTDGAGTSLFPGTIEGDWWEIDGAGSATTFKLTHNIGAGAAISFVSLFSPKYASY